MSRIDQVLSEIRGEVAKQELSKRQLALRAGLHPNTVLSMNDPKWNPAAETIRRLESVLFEGRRRRPKKRAKPTQH